ncbi:hypothetical protein, partial [Fodinibius sediminis]
MNLKKKLFHPDYDNYSILANLKFESKSIADFNSKIKIALKHPFTDHVIKANPFPKDYSDIRKARQVPFTNNIAGELGWVLHGILRYKAEIKEFLLLKRKFDEYILKGDYEKSLEILSDVEKKVGISLWSIENRFLVKEWHEGSEANWALLSEISDQIDSALILFMVECYSKRAEKKISYSRYSDFIKSKIDGLNDEALNEYFFFRLNYPAYKNYSHYYLFLSIESGFPLVDRFLLLIDILSEGLKNPDYNDLRPLKEALNKLEYFNDQLLIKKLKTLFHGIFERLEGSKGCIDLWDLYSKGKFKECLKLSYKEILNNPTVIESYEIYIKSLIELDKDFKKTGHSEIIDEILSNLYSILSRENNLVESARNLMKLSSAFHNTSWGKQVQGLTIKYTSRINKNSDNSFLYIVNSKLNNPRILNLLDQYQEHPIKYKEGFEKKYGNPLCYSINKWIVNGDYESITSNQQINPQRKFIYQGRALERGKEFEKLVNHLEEKYELLDLSRIEEEERIRQLYRSYIKIGNHERALLLYVDNYLENNQITTRFSSDALSDIIKEGNSDSLGKLVEFPIFYQIANTSAYSQYVAYDTFLSTSGFNKPSELYNRYEGSNTKLIYFLDKVCTVDLMQYSIIFSGQDEVESERRKLLRILLKIDSANEEKYIKEIAELTQTENVRKAIREVNKGRITVNIPQLKNDESSSIKEGFNRYQELSKYSENNEDAKGLDVSTKAIKGYIDNLLEEKKQDPEGITNDPAYISFKAMFLDLRDKFLLSKEYGLDGYLSTRIRHGTLENHIRSVFENHNLISERDSQGKYKGVEYWSEVSPGILERNLQKLQNDLKEFSREIDAQINYITQELIQIYTDKHNSKPNALFNFNFTQEYLWIAFRTVKDNISDQEEFINFVFRELQSHTEQRLKEVRKQFKGNIKNAFISEIDKLGESIDNSLGNGSYPELRKSILNSRTKINNELDRIAEWFYWVCKLNSVRAAYFSWLRVKSNGSRSPYRIASC